LTLYKTQQGNFHILSPNNSGHRAIADGKAGDKDSTVALHRIKSHIQKSVEVSMFNIDMILYIYLTTVGLTPGGSSTSHIYTQTVHIINRKENWEVLAVPRLCELYLGNYLTTKEKAQKYLSQGSKIQEQ
jgi:hypothetical protein